MYLLGFDKDGHSRLGSQYTWRIDLKTIRGATKRALIMQKANPTIINVYCIKDNEYSQNVCEMGKVTFESHIKSIGTKLI